MSPVFSIIVPVYNASQTLPRCLDSIINQDFRDFEVICVDDGSNDSSWSILGDYALMDSRVRLFSQSNAGPSAARNRGLKEMIGDYVLFVDSDDYFYSSEALSILNETIISNEGCELVYFAGAFVSSDGVFPDYTKKNKAYEWGYQCMQDNCLNKEGFVFGSVYVQCCKKTLLDNNSICFNEELIYGEDRLFVCTLFYYAKRTVEISDVLYCYVVNNGMSLMRNEEKLLRLNSDNRKVVYELDSLLKRGKWKLPNLKKYIHGLYVQSVGGMDRKDINWNLVFRNAVSFRLLVKDVLLFLGVFHYS